MAYSFQTFSLNQILTSAQMNQVEANIRDHEHGLAGVLLGPSHVKGWVNADSSGSAIDSYRVSSVTDNGTGDISVNWSVVFGNTDYVAHATIRNGGNSQTTVVQINTSLSTSVSRFDTFIGASAADPTRWMISAVGDQ